MHTLRFGPVRGEINRPVVKNTNDDIRETDRSFFSVFSYYGGESKNKKNKTVTPNGQKRLTLRTRPISLDTVVRGRQKRPDYRDSGSSYAIRENTCRRRGLITLQWKRVLRSWPLTGSKRFGRSGFVFFFYSIVSFELRVNDAYKR